MTYEEFCDERGKAEKLREKEQKQARTERERLEAEKEARDLQQVPFLLESALKGFDGALRRHIKNGTDPDSITFWVPWTFTKTNVLRDEIIAVLRQRGFKVEDTSVNTHQYGNASDSQQCWIWLRKTGR